jgi:hypothetical protein
MKLKKAIFYFCIITILLSCKKHNPEDPFLPHFNHLNDRLEGEWELVALHINEQVYSTFSKDDVYENYSYLLDIDTVNIAKFFKFVPTENGNKVEGKGELYIKSKNMVDYPTKVGISQNMLHNINDTNVATAALTYSFLEGSTDKDFFKFDATYIEDVGSLTSETPTFKPIDGYLVFNNFFLRYFLDFKIKKATKKELILYRSLSLNPELAEHATYRRYRLTFKKIK